MQLFHQLYEKIAETFLAEFICKVLYISSKFIFYEFCNKLSKFFIIIKFICINQQTHKKLLSGANRIVLGLKVQIQRQVDELRDIYQ